MCGRKVRRTTPDLSQMWMDESITSEEVTMNQNYYMPQQAEEGPPSEEAVQELGAKINALLSSPAIEYPELIWQISMIEVDKWAKSGAEVHHQRLDKINDLYVKEVERWEYQFQPFPAPPGPEVLSTGPIWLGLKIPLPDGSYYPICYDPFKDGALILLAGPPNVGKTTILHQTILSILEADLAGTIDARIHYFSAKKTDEAFRLYPWFRGRSNWFIPNVLPFPRNPLHSSDPQRPGVLSDSWPGMMSGRGHFTIICRKIQEILGIKHPSMEDIRRFTAMMLTPRSAGGLGTGPLDRLAIQRVNARAEIYVSQIKGYQAREGITAEFLMESDKHNFILLEKAGNVDARKVCVDDLISDMWSIKKTSPSLKDRVDFIIVDDFQEWGEQIRQREERVLEIFEDLADHGRSVGLRGILGFQHYGLISTHITNSASVTIAPRNVGNDVYSIAQHMHLDPRAGQVQALTQLPVGQALVFMLEKCPMPVRAQFDDFQAESPPLEVIKREMRPTYEELKKVVKWTPRHVDYTQIRTAAEAKTEYKAETKKPRKKTTKAQPEKPMPDLLPNQRIFMKAISRKPGMTRGGFEVIGYSKRQAEKILKSLQDDGWLEKPIRIKTDKKGAAPERYPFSDLAKQKFGSNTGNMTLEHWVLEHLVAKDHLTKEFPEPEFHVDVEFHIGQKAVDVAVTSQDGQLFVAVEVGSSQTRAPRELQNVVKCHELGAVQVVVLAADEKLRDHTEDICHSILSPDQITRTRWVTPTGFRQLKRGDLL